MATLTENKFKNLLSLLLCGGKSSRMGLDNGFLLSCHSERSEEYPINHSPENKPWSVSDADKFTTLNMPFVVSANLSQTHQTYFTVDMLCKSLQHLLYLPQSKMSKLIFYFPRIKVKSKNLCFTLLISK